MNIKCIVRAGHFWEQKFKLLLVILLCIKYVNNVLGYQTHPQLKYQPGTKGKAALNHVLALMQVCEEV